MSLGGLLLGAFFGTALSWAIGGRLWLFGPLGFVLPVLFAVAGAVTVRRLPGGRALSVAGLLLAGVSVAGFCWLTWTVLANRHGWF
jgi:hypothetical protein